MLRYFSDLEKLQLNEPSVKMTHFPQFLHPIPVKKAEMGSKNEIFHAGVF